MKTTLRATRRLSHPLILLALTSQLACSDGCGDATDLAPPPPDETPPAELPELTLALTERPLLRPAEGHDPTLEPSEGDVATGTSCLGYAPHIELTRAYEKRAKGFALDPASQITLELPDSLKRPWRDEDIDAPRPSLSHARQEASLAHDTARIYGVIIAFPHTGRHVFPVGGEGLSPDLERLCIHDQTPALSSYAEHVERCGTGFLDDEWRGGYVVFAFDTSAMSRTRRAQYADALGLHEDRTFPFFSLGALADLSAMFDEEPVRPAVSLHSVGLVPPDPALFDAQGWFDPMHMQQYFIQIEQARDAALEAGVRGDDPRLGELVLDQKVFPYHTSGINLCLSESGKRELDPTQRRCLATFWNQTTSIFRPEPWQAASPLLQTVTLTRWKLAHPGRVRWVLPKQEAMATQQQLVDRFDACATTQLDAAMAACEAAIADDAASLCEACQIDPACDPDALLREFDALPNTPLYPPRSFDTPFPEDVP